MNVQNQQPPPQQVPVLNPQQQLELRIRLAERAHDLQTEFGNKANDAAVKAAEEVIKASILINGGSAVAMLAFIGTLASKDLLSPAQLTEITKPLLWFGFGVASAVVGAAFAYFTHLMITGSSSRQARSYDEPFLRATAASTRHKIFGEIFRWIAIVGVAGSIVCFVGGLAKAQSAFGVLATKKHTIVAH
jgi:hypothetical protein